MPAIHPTTPRRRRRRAGLGDRLRADLLTGLAVVLPAGLTAGLLGWAIGIVDARVAPLLPGRPAFEQVAGFGVVIFLVLTVAVGAGLRNLALRRAIGAGERLAGRIPVVRWIHGAVKDVVASAVERGDAAFRQVCLIEYPREGQWTLGFLVAPLGGELGERTAEDLHAVFIATTPNPITGLLVLARRSEFRLLDLSVEDGIKLVISGGLIGSETPPG